MVPGNNILKAVIEQDLAGKFGQIDDWLDNIEANTRSTVGEISKLNENLTKLFNNISNIGNVTNVTAQNIQGFATAIGNVGASANNNGFGNITNSIGNIGNAAALSVNTLNMLAAALNKFSGGKTNDIFQFADSASLKELKAVIDYLNNQLLKFQKEDNKIFPPDQEQALVNIRDLLKEIFNIKNKSTGQKSDEAAKQELAAWEAETKNRRDLAKQKAKDEAEAAKQEEDALARYNKLAKERESLENSIAVTREKRNQNSVFAPVSKEEEDLLYAVEQRIKNIDKEMRALAGSSKAVQDSISQKRQNGQSLIEVEQKYLATAEVRAKVEAEIAKNKKKAAKEDLDASLKELETKRQIAQTNRNSYDGAMKYSQNAKTLEQERKAIKALKEARDRLNQSADGYQQKLSNLNAEIQRHTKNIKLAEESTREFTQHTQRAGVSLRQLASAFGVAFSLQSIVNFGRKIVETTGEFELQHRAMQAIIGDIREANKLWDKTVALAVRSPYRIKDLVSYTKQLSAYRIETDKLYDTTKMLADISSGLGVDMQRLILAYGQVKAANYLRGQELRQFSEAGVNILGELSKYFSELQGRAISTGEVFDMVSKRMVKFEDVAAVLHRLTEEGGTFFNMQEIQAETIKGQMENLKDSFDVFLNEIGSGKSKLISRTIEKIRDAMTDVNGLIMVANTALLTMAARFVAIRVETAIIQKQKVFSLMGKQINTAVTALTKYIVTQRAMAATGAAQNKLLERGVQLETRLNMLRKSGGTIGGGLTTIIAVAAVALAALYKKLTATKRALEEISDEIKKISGDAVKRATEEANNYSILVRQLGQANKGSKTRSEIIGKLNSQYGQYLDFQVTDATSQQDLAKAYDEVNKRLQEKAALEAYQDGLQKIDEELAKLHKNAEKKLGEALQARIGTGEFWENYEGEKIERTLSVTKRELTEIQAILRNTLASMETEDFDEVSEQVEIINEVIRKYFGNDELHFKWGKRAIEFFDMMIEKAEKTKELQDEISANTPQTNVAEANRELEAIELALDEKIKALESGKTPLTTTLERDIEEARREAEKQKIDVYIKYNIVAEDAGTEQKNAIDNWASKTVKSINDKLQEYSEKYSKETFFNTLLINPDEAKSGITEITKARQAAYDADKASVKELNRLKAQGLLIDELQLESLTERMNANADFLRTLGIDPDANGNKALETLNKQIDAIKNAAKQYDEYKKMYDDTKAFEKTKNEVEGLFKELNIGKILNESDAFNEDVIKKNLNGWLAPSIKAAGKAGRQAAEKYLRELQLRFDQEDFKKDLEGMKNEMEEAFADYNMFKELGKLGIGKDFASLLFGVQTSDLQQLRDKLAEQAKTLQNSLGEAYKGSDAQKAIQEMEKKISDIEDKEQKERLKKYVAYTKQAMTERAKIEVEGLQELAEIEKTFQKEIEKAQNAGNTERAEQIQQLLDAAVEGSKRATNEKLQKQAWEDFKGSDMYVEMFNDIGNASTKVIEAIQEKIGELRKSLKDLNPSDLKAITQEITKLEDELIKRNPAKAYFDLFKQVRDLQKQGKGEDALMLQMGANDAEIENLNDQIAGYERLIEKRRQFNQEQIDSEGESNYIKMNMSLQSQVEQWKKLIEQKKKDNAATAEDLKTYKRFRNASKGFADYLQNMGGRVASIFSDIMSNLEAFGGETTNTSEAWGDLFSSITSIIATIPNYILLMKAAGVAANEALGVVGWIVTAVEVLVALIKSVANIKNAKIDDEIDSYKEKVEALEDAYDRTEKAFDRAFNIDKLRILNAEMDANLEKQIAYYEKMIAAEKRRKSPDQDAIDEYEAAINDIYDEIDDRHEKFIQEAGGLAEGDFKDAAQGFVDAWYDAYSETGDGLEALRDNFDKILQNFVKKQAMLRIAGAILEPLFKQIETAASDGVLDPTEMQNIMAMAEEKFPQLNEMLKTFFESMGMFGENAEGELSGLQKGIQGVTEETAEIIAAYLNSLRFYVIDTNTKVGQLVNALQDNTGVANPMLQELRNIASRADDIYSFLFQRRETGSDSLRVYVVN